MTSLHRRASEQTNTNTDGDEDEEDPVYESRSGLRIDSSRRIVVGSGDEEDTPITPMAAETQVADRVRV